jgi:hypothetical protein
MSRPAGDAAQRRTRGIRFRVTATEWALLADAAAHDNAAVAAVSAAHGLASSPLSPHEWVRATALDAAKKKTPPKRGH